MKTALYIKENIQQVVLTPENEHEKNLLLLVNKKGVETTIKTGTFEECQGGWIRHYSGNYSEMYGVQNDRMDSLMLVLRENKE